MTLRFFLSKTMAMPNLAYIFIFQPNQNDEADTISAAYSVRTAKTPSVSTPMQWKETIQN